MSEKRKHQRRPLVIEARFQDRFGKIIKGSVSDISMSGASIETNEPLNPDTPLNLSLDLVDFGKVVEVHCRVVRVRPGESMGVKFSSDSDRQVAAIMEYGRPD